MGVLIYYGCSQMVVNLPRIFPSLLGNNWHWQEVMAAGMVDSFAEFYPEARERFTCSLASSRRRWATPGRMGIHPWGCAAALGVEDGGRMGKNM